ncbi:preprotein translocase subunit SecE [Thermomonas sp. S9]|uniref:preprotein translocase subunit SecE n=1 Tax=Thermomonas sp. S9 TaxID=2885203 RepID=UPI001ACD9EBF|nr:preprotein translocase subunit SecE [Thermomonas sp. S9]MBN8715350.1 preprotein translocase subunit SecE [Xanthomonadales bacterium]MBN8769898.1 preprotein translocase subunit SecE [Stenotrophomonas sp.]MCR6497234.1 preprotein translocase subunit SecE [Thermomonas sp. S9]
MTSNSLPRPSAGSADIVKYVLAALLVAAGVFVYYWFDDGVLPGVVRVLAVLAGLGLGGWVFLLTGAGRRVREFLSESRFELRKVVWPTRQEATRTMWIVVIAVIAISLILAAFDWVIQLGVKTLLGS